MPVVTSIVIGFGGFGAIDELASPWRPARRHTCTRHSACGARRAMITRIARPQIECSTGNASNEISQIFAGTRSSIS
jgi:hypothetical protein